MAKRNVMEKPEDHSFTQSCGDPWGSAGEPADKTLNDVSEHAWSRGGSRMPHSDHGNSWRQGRNPKLRE